MTNDSSRRTAVCTLFALALAPAAALFAAPVQAHGSEASAASSVLLSVPVAALSVAPAMILSAGATLSVVAVDTLAGGTVWLLRRTSDGATASLRLGAEIAGGVLVVAGSVILVTAVAAGWLLSVAGEVICLVPNTLGEALLYNERIR